VKGKRNAPGTELRQTAVVRIRIRPDLKRKLEEIAEAEDRKLSTMARLLLKFAIAQCQRAGSMGELMRATLTLPAKEAKDIGPGNGA
jgi:hypothetical protein